MAVTTETYPYKPARLRKPEKGATDQRWMIVWWQWSVKDEKMVRRRQGFMLASIESKRQREKKALELIDTINRALKKGMVWDPEKVLRQEKPLKRKQAITVLSTLLDAYDFFYARQQAAGHAKSTLDGYVNLRKFIDEWLKDELGERDLRVKHFTADLAEDYCEWQARRPSRRGPGPISNKTYNNYLIYIKAFCNWMVAQEIIKAKNNPFKAEKKKKAQQSTQHRPYTNEQLRDILAACDRSDRQQLKLYLQFLYYTFARPRAEVRLLRVEDLRQETIWIRPDQDKNRVGRHVEIPPDLEQLITEHRLRTYPPHYYLFGNEGQPGPEPSGQTTFFNQFKHVLAELELVGQSYDLYGFKHTGNINLYLATKDLTTVQKQNGHSSLSMTERYLRDLGVIRNEKVVNNFPKMGG